MGNDIKNCESDEKNSPFSVGIKAKNNTTIPLTNISVANSSASMPCSAKTGVIKYNDAQLDAIISANITPHTI